MATTRPLTTEHSADAPVPKDSASRASKSARVGVSVSADFAMRSVFLDIEAGPRQYPQDLPQGSVIKIGARTGKPRHFRLNKATQARARVWSGNSWGVAGEPL